MSWDFAKIEIIQLFFFLLKNKSKECHVQFDLSKFSGVISLRSFTYFTFPASRMPCLTNFSFTVLQTIN